MNKLRQDKFLWVAIISVFSVGFANLFFGSGLKNNWVPLMCGLAVFTIVLLGTNYLIRK